MMAPRDNVIPLHRGAQLAPRPREEDRSPPPPTRIDLYAEWLQREPSRPPTLREQLADDWASLVAGVRAAPVSHLLVAIGAVAFWTLLLVAPLYVGWAG